MFKRFAKILIVLWEKFICMIENIQPIEGSNYNLICIKKVKYRGNPLSLSESCILTKGDYLIEMHLSNILLAKGKVGNATVASDLQLFSYIRNELYTLGKLLRSEQMDANIKAIGGVTIHGPGIRRFGFSLYPSQVNFHNTIVTLWMRFLRWVFSNPKEVVKNKNRSPRHLEYFYMPLSQFIQKYGS